MKRELTLGVLLLSIMLIAAGCGGLFSDSGELALSIADAPVNDIEKVNVTLEEVQVSGPEGWETINDFSGTGGEVTFDLLTLRFDEELLGQEALPEGDYNQIRLIVAAEEEGADNPTIEGKSHVVYSDDKDKDNIFIPSGVQTGLKINHNFTIEEGVINQLLLDVDVREMMHTAGESGKIILQPTAIDVIDQVISGDIEGQVKVPDDDYSAIDGDILVNVLGEDKATVATMEADEDADKPAGSYLLRGLEEGTYTLEAKVVNGDGSDADGYKTDTTEVSVEAEETITADDLKITKTN